MTEDITHAQLAEGIGELKGMMRGLTQIVELRSQEQARTDVRHERRLNSHADELELLQRSRVRTKAVIATIVAIAAFVGLKELAGYLSKTGGMT